MQKSLPARFIFTLVLSVLCLTETAAQWDVQFSDYTSLKSYYNPAASGTDGLLNVNAAYSMQMAGFDDAPKTMYVGADCPVYFLGPRHGAGVNFMNDIAGIFRTQRLAIQYAYNVPIGRKGRLAIGGQAAMISEKIDPTGLEFPDQDTDPAFPSSEVSGTSMDVAAGLYFHHPLFWAGASASHITSPRITMAETHFIDLSPVYYLMGGCNIKIKNTLLTLKPSFMVQSDFDSWREDINCKLEFVNDGKKLWGGVGYSPDISTTFMIGGNFHGISLGYSYQMYTSGINMVNGTHELVLSYQTDLDLFKKGHNKHRAVRVL